MHNLRTSTRTLETAISTLRLDSKRKVRELLHALSDVRKRAGKVRDMDVLTADVLTIHDADEQDCIVQLLEYLGAQRSRYAKRLRRTIDETGDQLRRNLKRTTTRLERHLERSETGGPRDVEAVPTAMARTLALSTELKMPTRLNKKTLHPYRLKVKELRDVLQLSQRTGDKGFFEQLGEVKDAIGDWHDWEELIVVANRLDHGPACKLIKAFRQNSDTKYEHALRITERFRSKYLEAGTHKRKTGTDKIALLPAPVFRSASAIAQ
ncbi:MAG TPA: CHAD domain-containing protein [Terriglobia bacterium]|nr:CHAD domain-containing protein [Terriglobia bacterium]